MAVTPFAVFVTSTLIIIAVFGAVAFSAKGGASLEYSRTNRFRLIFLASLSVILVTFLGATLRRLPYAAEARAPERIVHGAVARELGSGVSPTVTVARGAAVEFRVTTLDVNHGFSLYSPDGRLVAQTQAMPGYMNRLRVTFDRPGTYTVLCLEFCGMSHHRMRGVVEVQ
jgi:cytochrome c oxidase subunit II